VFNLWVVVTTSNIIGQWLNYVLLPNQELKYFVGSNFTNGGPTILMNVKADVVVL
jgi:hypothetical protein